jgi:proteasome component ECM29
VLEKALAGKTWDGKEVVLKAFVKFASQAQKLWQGNKQLNDSMKVSLVLRTLYI